MGPEAETLALALDAEAETLALALDAEAEALALALDAEAEALALALALDAEAEALALALDADWHWYWTKIVAEDLVRGLGHCTSLLPEGLDSPRHHFCTEQATVTVFTGRHCRLVLQFQKEKVSTLHSQASRVSTFGVVACPL